MGEGESESKVDYSCFRNSPKLAILLYFFLNQSPIEEPKLRKDLMSDLGLKSDRTIKSYLSDMSIGEILEKDRVSGKQNFWNLRYSYKTIFMVCDLIELIYDSVPSDFYHALVRLFKSQNYHELLNSKFFQEKLKEDLMIDISNRDSELLFNLVLDGLHTLPSLMLGMGFSFNSRYGRFYELLGYKELSNEEKHIRIDGLIYWFLIGSIGNDRDLLSVVSEGVPVDDNSLYEDYWEIIENINRFAEKWKDVLDPVYELIDASLTLYSNPIN